MTFRMESRIPPLFRNNPDETTDKSIDHKKISFMQLFFNSQLERARSEICKHNLQSVTSTHIIKIQLS